MIVRTEKDLKRHAKYGYKVIRLGKRFALIRNWSVCGFRLRNRIPLYVLVKIVKEK